MHLLQAVERQQICLIPIGHFLDISLEVLSQALAPVDRDVGQLMVVMSNQLIFCMKSKDTNIRYSFRQITLDTRLLNFRRGKWLIGSRSNGNFYIGRGPQGSPWLVCWREVGPENHLLVTYVVLHEPLVLNNTLGSKSIIL